MAEDESFWNPTEASTGSSVNEHSKPLPQPPLQLDTSLLSPPPAAHLQPAVDLTKNYPSDEEASEFPLASSPVQPPARAAPMLIPQTNRSMSSIHSLSKGVPADPHTTKADVESQLLSTSASSSINDTVADLAGHAQFQQAQLAVPKQQDQPPSTPTLQTTGAFFNSMFSAATSSLQFRKTPTGDTTADTDKTIMERSPSVSSVDAEKIAASPNMLSYRRSKGKGKGRRNTSISSIEVPESPLAEAEKPYFDGSFDANMYVEETFKGTNYHYATEARNETFHGIFKSIPEDERLLDDFSCALSREILLQGRAYISEHNVCFNSNLLGWVTTLVIPFSDINGFEKTATVGLFPNGIAVSSKDGVKSFASFISRDNVYHFLTTVWKASGDNTTAPSSSSGTHFLSLNGPLVLTKEMDNSVDDVFNAALLSIDGDSPAKRKNSDTTIASNDDDDDDDEDDDDDDDEEEDESDSVGSSWSEMKTSNQSVHSLKDISKYSYSGTLAHHITRCPYVPEENNETILARENLKCPPGLLHEFIFGKNTDMVIEFLKSQDSRDFSDISDYNENDDGKKERHYDYIKGLNYSVGPKKTKCVVKETIEHLDYDGYINVVNTTQTPDVPSGGAFCVKTRYIMTWGPGNTTDLVISYWIHWMGSSWVKGVIEKSTKSGQTSAAAALVEIIKKTVDENVEEKVETVKLTTSTESLQEEEVLEKPTVVQPVTVVPAGKAQSIGSVSRFTPFNYVVLALLSTIVLLQLLTIHSLRSIPNTANSLSSIPLIEEIGKYTGDLLFRGEEVLIWSWIDERAGKLDMSRSEKVKLIQKDIDTLLQKWNNGELNTEESHLIVKEFEESLNAYAKITGDDEEKQQKAMALRKAIHALI